MVSPNALPCETSKALKVLKIFGASFVPAAWWCHLARLGRFPGVFGAARLLRTLLAVLAQTCPLASKRSQTKHRKILERPSGCALTRLATCGSGLSGVVALRLGCEFDVVVDEDQV